MVCKHCGKELKAGAKFCTGCGEHVISDAPVLTSTVNESSNSFAQEPAFTPIGVEHISPFNQAPAFTSGSMDNTGNFSQPMGQAQYRDVFVEPNEQLLGTLGNGYLANILYRKMKSCNALLTDKRVYFQGTLLIGSGKAMIREKTEKVIDLEDITGTGFTYSNPIGIIGMFIISVVIPWIAALIYSFNGYYARRTSPIVGLVGTVVGMIICMINYILNRKATFRVEYAGGVIAFRVSIHGLNQLKDFHKQIRRAKDHKKEGIS